ncbi:hypothetical protein AMTRI_Chr08g201840 [Amborella trichopoda]
MREEEDEKEDLLVSGKEMREEKEEELLVVGNYCHDVLFRDGLVVGETLGGAASFISQVLESLYLSSKTTIVAKVGPNFAYSSSPLSLLHPPVIASSSLTTLFHAHFFNDQPDRTLRRICACDPISPSDLPTSSLYDFGMAVGVGGETTVETLARMLDLCDTVLVDVQALIRTFDPVDGAVQLISLSSTPFFSLISRVQFLKTSAEESRYLDIEELRRGSCVIVTDGAEGCHVYWREGEFQVPAFRAVEVDPTGAGDSFLGGFAAGLVCGLSVRDAALLGNFFGALTVSHIGVPELDPVKLQRVKDEIEKRSARCINGCKRKEGVTDFGKSVGFEEFRAVLAEVALDISGRQNGPFNPPSQGLELVGNLKREW